MKRLVFDDPGEKTCTICKQVKITSQDMNVSEFYYNRLRHQYHSECKSCHIVKSGAWAKTHRSDLLASVRKYNAGKGKEFRWKLRLEIIEAYGGKCACCGETIPEFLTVDHIDGRGAEHRRSMKFERGGQDFYKWLKKEGFPKDNYQLLCCNCNIAKGQFRVCPHQRAAGVKDRPQSFAEAVADTGTYIKGKEWHKKWDV
jgi:hypothetical protein